MRDTGSCRRKRGFGYRSIRISLIVVSTVAAAGATTATAAVGATVATTVDAGVVDVTDFAIGHGRIDSRNSGR